MRAVDRGDGGTRLPFPVLLSVKVRLSVNRWAVAVGVVAVSPPRARHHDQEGEPNGTDAPNDHPIHRA
jgi:hypothetical protein